MTAKKMFEAQKPGESHDAAGLAKMMEKMNEEVTKTGGMSTAVVAKVNQAHENGSRTGEGETAAPKEYLSYASVGDSRLYVIHKNGEVERLTEDEGEGNTIWNILGLEAGERKEVREHIGLQEEASICMQFKDVWLEEGDRIVLCSDGVSGDKEGDMLTNEEIGKLASTRTTEQAAEALIRAAKKLDDRTVIVFDA